VNLLVFPELLLFYYKLYVRDITYLFVVLDWYTWYHNHFQTKDLFHNPIPFIDSTVNFNKKNKNR